MDTIATDIPTTLGAPFAGGFITARIRIGDDVYALIVAPKKDGEHEDESWSKNKKSVAGAASFFDGLANTEAMAAAGSPLAKWARDLRIGGFDDWYLPSRDELEILYRALKPTKNENYVWRNGDNPSSVPPGYPYTEDSPAQTAASAFQKGGAEAFEATWYWTSTQSAGYESYAWCQSFSDGYQDYGHKGNVLRARAVRRVKI
jgi:hypothetical protein